MITNIDIEKCKATDTLRFKVGFYYKLIYYVFIFILPVIYLTEVFSKPTLFITNFTDQLIDILFFAFIIFLFVQLTSPRKMMRIKRQHKKQNEENVIKAIKNLGWEISNVKQDSIVAKPQKKFWNSDKQVTVIFDNEDILISSIRLGRYGDVPSFSDEENLKKLVALL